MFFHQTAFNHGGAPRLTAAFVTEKLKMIEREDARAAEIIAEKTGRTIESVYEWQHPEKLMENKEALEVGLIHEIRPLVIPKDAWVTQVVT